MVTIINRPIKAGNYSIQIQLTQPISVEEANKLIVSLAGQNALAQDGSGIIGIWKGTNPYTQKPIYTAIPSANDQVNQSYGLTFSPGAAIAKVPQITAGPLQTNWIEAALILTKDQETPQGWIPKTTILDQNGKPISETSTTGQTVNLQPGAQQQQQTPPLLQPPQTGQASYFPGADYGIDQGFGFDAGYGMDAGFGYNGSGIVNGDIARWGDYSNLMQGGGVDPGMTFAGLAGLGQSPWLVAAIPYIYKGVLWIGVFVSGFLVARYLWQNVNQILIQPGLQLTSYLWQKIKAAIDKLAKSGLLVPIFLGGIGLLALTATS